MDDVIAREPATSEPAWQVEEVSPGAAANLQASNPGDKLDEELPTPEHDEYDDEDDSEDLSEDLGEDHDNG